MGFDLDCAAIVGTLDRADVLGVCLESLAAADPAFREVIVADQGQGGLLREPVEARGARYLHLDRAGLAHARNQALARATAAWAFFPDDDCTVAPDLLLQASQALERFPQAAFLCGRIEVPGGEPIMVGMDRRERVLRTPEEVLRTVMSPGLFVRRSAIDQVGGFDESFGVGARFPSGEESDLLLRALAVGLSGLYAPQVRVFHPDQFASRDPEAQIARAYQYGRGWGALFAKHSAGTAGGTFRRLQRRYLLRALGGAAVAAVTGRLPLVRRYAASLRGRWQGGREYARGGDGR